LKSTSISRQTTKRETLIIAESFEYCWEYIQIEDTDGQQRQGLGRGATIGGLQ